MLVTYVNLFRNKIRMGANKQIYDTHNMGNSNQAPSNDIYYTIRVYPVDEKFCDISINNIVEMHEYLDICRNRINMYYF